MNRISVLATLTALAASGALCAQTPALAQAAAPVGAQCIPATPGVPPAPPPAPGQAPRPPQAAPAPRDLTITAIPGVVAGGGAWKKVWQQGGNSADGTLPDKDGGVLVAQEDYDAVLHIAPDGSTSVAVAGAKGLGSMSMDRQGRLYGAHRTERPGSTKPDIASIVNAITELAPNRHTIADKWTDGSVLTVRPNDLAADGTGGAFFTQGCLYYAGPKGASVVADNLRTNGIIFSTDDKTLYVTNGPGIVAFDVTGPGTVANRRDFAALQGPGDGLAIDDQGRLYVTTPAGVQVLDKSGKSLGVIPTPRAVIAISFSGPDKKTLYVVGGGADDADGKPIRMGPQQTAATVYSLPVLARGIQGRGK